MYWEWFTISDPGFFPKRVLDPRCSAKFKFSSGDDMSINKAKKMTI